MATYSYSIVVSFVDDIVIMSKCFYFNITDGQEVKVGEYNAIADVLDLINNSIRFQGMKNTPYMTCVR